MKKPIQPPTHFICLLILLILFHFIFPIKKIIYSPYNYFGIPLILFGIIINLWADQLFKKIKTNVKHHKIPNKLIISGPFKISRNPMYLGMLSILLGVAIFQGSIIGFIFSIIFILIIEKKYIPLEEKNMKKTFGKNYLNYKQKVRKWV